MNLVLADVERRCQEWQSSLTDMYADEVAERRDASFDFYPWKSTRDSSVDLN